MIILPDAPATGEQDPAGPSVEDILRNAPLQRACRAFLSDSLHGVPAGEMSVCVAQGEQALVAGPEQQAWVGSEDATTCVIAAILCRGTAWVAHFDETTCNDTAAIEAAAEQVGRLAGSGSGPPQLLLVGAQQTASLAGLKTLQALLHNLHRQPVVLRLTLACVDAANTDAAGGPRTRQLALNLRTGSAHPATFADRGPQLPRRMAYNLLFASRLRSEGGAAQLQSIFDTSTCTIKLSPAFDPKLAPSLLVLNCERLLHLADADLLRLASTTPQHEGPNFLPDLRSMYAFVLAAQDAADEELSAMAGEATYVWSYDRRAWVLAAP